jgi:hypothetical protein
MILAGAVGKFRLQKDVFACEHARAISGGQSLAHSFFEVMAALIGGIDGAKTGAQRQLDECWGSFFLPGSAVEKTGKGRGLRRGHGAILARAVMMCRHLLGKRAMMIDYPYVARRSGILGLAGFCYLISGLQSVRGKILEPQ